MPAAKRPGHRRRRREEKQLAEGQRSVAGNASGPLLCRPAAVSRGGLPDVPRYVVARGLADDLRFGDAARSGDEPGHHVTRPRRPRRDNARW